MINIIEAIDDPNLFNPWFVKKPESWQTWRVFLSALFGLPMDYKMRRTFNECTKRTDAPKTVSEAWLICGRRSGKSFISSLIAVYLGCFGDHEKYLTVGEKGTIMLIASDRKQARILHRYCSALLQNVPMLKRMVERETADTIELNNRCVIEIHTASYRSTRGYTLIAAIADEIAFWETEDSSNPDVEILDSLRPGMSTIPNSKLLCISSPYAKKGALFETYKKYYGRDHNSILVWQAPTVIMNPSVPKRIIDEAYERDPVSAASEYGAEFRPDISQFISREALESCIVKCRMELSPIIGAKYEAFCDPSGGSADSFTLAIAHTANGKKILDCVREVRPPFKPDAIVKEYADLLRRYWLSSVIGDRFGGTWVESKFAEFGISYKTSPKTKTQIYTDFLPLLNSGEIELLDNKRLSDQLLGLERRSGRIGNDSIDHTFNQHDDVANAVAGAFTCSQQEKRAGIWGSTKSDNARLMQGTRFGKI